jgi:hypothetical protein
MFNQQFGMASSIHNTLKSVGDSSRMGASYQQEPVLSSLPCPRTLNSQSSSQEIDDFADAAEQEITRRPAFRITWRDLSYVGKSVVLFELSTHFQSFQEACRKLMLPQREVEKWM